MTVPETVASLGLMSPGAATRGCHPIFPLKSDDLFSCRLSPLPSSHVVYPVFFLNSASKNKFHVGCHPPVEGFAPHPVTPLSGDLVYAYSDHQWYEYCTVHLWTKVKPCSRERERERGQADRLVSLHYSNTRVTLQLNCIV